MWSMNMWTVNTCCDISWNILIKGIAWAQALQAERAWFHLQVYHNFLSDRKQYVKLGTHISTGSPQDCVLSYLLFSLYTNSCTSTNFRSLMDTTLIVLISGGSLIIGGKLKTWCSQNNLELNALKTVEMVVDFRKNTAPLTPITLCNNPVNTVESFHFLGTILFLFYFTYLSP